ncbi:MAG: ExbD/TolR family protein [Bacteroidia bacterium]
MAEVNTGGGGGGKHQKKGRKSTGTPRVDMTPMVDLAFLLLTFFVLTSQLNKTKATELIVPKKADDNVETTKIDSSKAVTFMLDGNKKGIIYYYTGMLPKETGKIQETSFDPKKGVRLLVKDRNREVIVSMNELRKQLVSEKIDKAAFDTLSLDENHKSMFSAPFFIVKWGGDATYGQVIDLIDELKICDVGRYALTKISQPEYQVLSVKTGVKYKDMLPPSAVPEEK